MMSVHHGSVILKKILTENYGWQPGVEFLNSILLPEPVFWDFMELKILFIQEDGQWISLLLPMDLFGLQYFP